jgi:hypothetical protein
MTTSAQNDEIVIEGDTIEEIQVKTYDMLASKHADINSAWSEPVEEL